MRRCHNMMMYAGAVLVASAGIEPARADDPPASTFNGNVTVASDYMFRAQTQTNHHPALQATLEYDHASGFYIGSFGSNVTWVKDAMPDPAPGDRVRNNIETDLWAGYRNKLGTDWSYDLGLYEYYYPGSYPSSDYVRPHTFEGYAQIGWKFFSFRYWQALSDWFGDGNSVHSQYYDLNFSQEIVPSWTLGAHAGHQYVAGSGGRLSYSDWRLSLSKAFAHNFSVALTYTQGNASRTYYTNPDGHYLTRGTVVLNITKAFSF